MECVAQRRRACRPRSAKRTYAWHRTPSHLPVMVQRLTQRMLAFQDIPAGQLHAIRAPALLIFGDRDVYRPEHFIQMYEQLPNAQLAVFPNSHHGQYMGEVSSPGPYPFVDAFLTMVTTFLDVH